MEQKPQSVADIRGQARVAQLMAAEMSRVDQVKVEKYARSIIAGISAALADADPSISSLLTRRKISRDKLAMRLGISRNILLQYESGEIPMPLAIGLALAAIEFQLSPLGGGK
jgi:hypothetical protein